MSFFKKTESTVSNDVSIKDEENSLFVEEIAVKGQGGEITQTPTPPRDERLPLEIGADREKSPDSRYNEDLVPSKRRRIGEDLFQASRSPDNQTPKAQTKGPFVDDSDSEQDDGTIADSIVTEVKTNTITRDGVTPISTPTPNGIGRDTDSQENLAPRLKRETTSIGEANDFDGLEDFIDDEFPEDGEEYVERRWMEEQAELEIGLEDEDMATMDESAATLQDSSRPTEISPELTGSSVCPICGGSTAGMAEQVCQCYLVIEYKLTAAANLNTCQ